MVPICAPLISAKPDCDPLQAKHLRNPGPSTCGVPRQNSYDLYTVEKPSANRELHSGSARC